MTITPRRARFVEEYLVDLNATHAAARAGYSPSMARRAAYRLLGDPAVEAAVAEAKAARSAEVGISARDVLEELWAIGFSDIRRVASWGEAGADGEQEIRIRASDAIDGRTARAILEISRAARGGVKVRMHDKLGALNALARHLGMVPDRTEAAARPADEEAARMRALTDRMAALTPEKRAALRDAIRTALEP